MARLTECCNNPERCGSTACDEYLARDGEHLRVELEQQVAGPIAGRPDW